MPFALCRRSVVSLVASLAFLILSAQLAIAAPKFVYVLNQVSGGPNLIYGYRIDGVTGALTLLSGFPVTSGGLGGSNSYSEHLTFSNNGRLFVVNGGSISLSVFDVSPTGSLTAAPFSPISLTGDLACVTVHPSGSPVIVGSNTGFTSVVLTATTATIAPGSPFATTGASPFSCGMSRDGGYVYTGGNFGSTIAGFSVDVNSGVLTPLPGSPFNSGAESPVGYATDNSGRLFSSNYYSAGVRVFTTSSGVPAGVTGNPFSSGLSGGVQGVVHPAGFYIVADREVSRVGVFQIAGSGAATTLTAVSGSPFATGGIFTDAVALSPDGRFLVAANGVSRNLTTFQVNTSTGVLTSLGVQPVNTLGATGLLTGIAFAGGSAAPSDFDGDAKSDVSVFRPSTGTWFIRNSGTPTDNAVGWGGGNDIPVARDYDGDGKTDIAVFRPSTGTWFIRNSGTPTDNAVGWGGGTDIPVPSDYDGDGKADIAVFRPSTGTWFIRNSATPTDNAVGWGGGTDVPMPGDWDADGKSDIAIYRPSNFTWYIRNTATPTSTIVTWGSSLDEPVGGDFDGDGKIDPTVFRRSSGNWFILRSSTNYSTSLSLTWGGGNDVAVPGDYDGDGISDAAVFRPSTGQWFIRFSATPTSATILWGGGSDIPTLKRP